MPLLSQHQSNEYTKMLIMGDSGSGKTGGLTSLVKAGYKLRISDYDNGLEPLKQFILKECPERIDDVEYRTLRDKRKATPLGPLVDGQPTAFVEGRRMLDKWAYNLPDGTKVDYGVPSEWGPDVIFVLDSLTFFATAAYDWALPLVPRSRSTGEYDKRAVYWNAQGAVEDAISFVTSESFRTNVIIIAHIRYVENDDRTRKGYPNTIGAALSPLIPRYFNSVALCQTRTGGNRTIQTLSTSMIDLKNPKPFAMAPSYDLSTGLAEFFSVLREPPAKIKPTIVRKV